MLVSLAQKTFSAVRRSKNRLLNKLDTPVVILVYHRVADLAADPQLLAVSPENFRAHMQHLKTNFPVLRFEESWSEVEEPAVAVTFDDGYADNAIEALPILEEVGIPATFFVSTGNLGTTREFWWDELDRLLLGDYTLVENLELNTGNGKQSWQAATPADRLKLYQELHPLLQQLDGAGRENCIMQLRKWAGTDETGRTEYRALSLDELKRLAASAWTTIGAHTVTHTPLSNLSLEQQRDEISASKNELEKVTGQEIKTFSYPFGRKSDYTKDSVRICQEAGFIKAAANFPGQVHRWTDPFQLPRQLVRNWELEIFTEKLKDFWI